jgi:hypothetical protein
MADFYSPWVAPPNGGVNYRLHYNVELMSQDVEANTSTVSFGFEIQKDRSAVGFLGFSGYYSAAMNATPVWDQTAVKPDKAWNGWSTWLLGQGTLLIPHTADGTKSFTVDASYVGANSQSAPGILALPAGCVVTLQPIERATTPTVSPSPAAIGSTVTIDLPRANAAFVHDITWVCGTQSGTISTSAGTSVNWIVPNVMGQPHTDNTAIIGITVVTRNGAKVLGSKQILLAARDVIATPPEITMANAANQLDIRARVVEWDGSEWSARRTLPTTDLSIVDPLSATTTVSLSLSKAVAPTMQDFSIVDVDVYDGKDWRFTNHRFVLSRTETDDIDLTQIGQYTGTEFVDYILGFAYTPGDYQWDGGPGEALVGHAMPTNPGKMMRYAILDAQSRGWGPRLHINFDENRDSNGVAWLNNSISRVVPKGTPLSQMLAGLVDDGLVEYRTEYRDGFAWLVLTNPGTGNDYSTAGAVPVVNLGLAKLTRAPRRASMEQQLSSVTVVGDEGVSTTRTKVPFSSVYGTMEGWVSASGIKDVGAANMIGDNALRDNSTPTNERTFEYEAGAVAPQYNPYISFRNGDWVLIPDGDTTVRDRVSQTTISKTVDAKKITVLTGDRILGGVAGLAKRQAAQTGGAIAGGNGQTPTTLDSRVPVAPAISSVTSKGYWTKDGTARSSVTITWGAVSTSVGGGAIPVGLYEVWWRPSGIGAAWSFKGSTDQTTIALGDWDVLTAIDIRVRAQSTAGVFGEFSANTENYTTLAPLVDLSGPKITDLYTDGLGTIYVVWGGILGVSDPAPTRMAYVSAELSTDGGATFFPYGNPIPAAGTAVLYPKMWGTFWVRLRAFDKLGNPGTASAAQSITLVDPHVAPTTPPAPTNLTATPGAAWDASGFLPEAWFDLNWTAPSMGIAPTVLASNLLLNPSFENPSAAIVTRTNLYTDPNCMNLKGGVNGATTSLVGGVGGKTRTVTPAGGVVDSGVNLGVPATTAAGWRTYSVDVTATTADTYRLSIQSAVGSGTASVVLAAGETKRVGIAINHTGAGAISAYILRSNAAVSETFDITNILVEDFWQVLPFFSATTPAGDDFTYNWLSTPNASVSQQKAIGVATVSGGNCVAIQSSNWSKNGAKSLRLIPNNKGAALDTYGRIELLPQLVEGKTYTIMGTARLASPQTGGVAGPSQARNLFLDITGGGGGTRAFGTSPVTANAAGEYQHRIKFTVPSVAGSPVTTLGLRMYNGSSAGEVYWDAMILIEGDYTGPYFDGSSPATPDSTYVWTGGQHSSVSQRQVPMDQPQVIGYDVLGLRASESVERLITSTSSGTSTTARIKVGNGETWTFRVRAATNFGGVSAPSASVTATANATIAVAAAPGAPTLDQYAGLLRIKWSGAGMLPSIKYAYGMISTTATGTFTRAGMPLIGAGEIPVSGLAPGTYYAKIVIVDEAGNSSTSAVSAPLTLLPITGVTIQTSELANTGIKLTTGSLTSYDASGRPTFVLNAATGEVWIAPYESVFDIGAAGASATTGAAVTGVSISSENSSFNTFVHPSGVQIRNDQTPLSWWEGDVSDASLVNFFSPRVVVGQRLRIGDFEMLREARGQGSKLVIRYKGA